MNVNKVLSTYTSSRTGGICEVTGSYALNKNLIFVIIIYY